MATTDDTLIAAARALQASIDDDRSTNETRWSRADDAFAALVVREESAIERRESRGLRLAYVVFGLGSVLVLTTGGNLHAIGGKVERSGPGEWMAILAASALIGQLLVATSLAHLLWTLREHTRRSARLTLRLRASIDRRDGAVTDASKDHVLRG